MGTKADHRRRSIGIIFLMAALAMLVMGETVLEERLEGFGFIVFWLVCLLFTGLAVLVAFLDLSAIRRRTRQEHRSLVENTLQDIGRTKKNPPQPRGGDSR